jgi:hypothetical protein
VKYRFAPHPAQYTNEFPQTQIDYERQGKTMHNKIAAVAICFTAFAMSAAAQVTGSGTAGTVPVFTGSGTSIGNSSAPITVSSTGNVGIGTTAPGTNAPSSVSGTFLEVNGNVMLTQGGSGKLVFPDGTTQTTAFIPR